jgi:hypothetical protein
VHRHHVGACELPIDASPSTVAAAMRLAVWIRVSVTSDGVGRVPTGRRADWL